MSDLEGDPILSVKEKKKKEKKRRGRRRGAGRGKTGEVEKKREVPLEL